MPFQLDLPDIVDVVGYRCVRVYVPDSNEYESALHSLLTYAGNWFGWEKDEAKQGKNAAQLWRNAYQLTTGDFLAGVSCEECKECEECEECKPKTIGGFPESVMGFPEGMINEMLCGVPPGAFDVIDGWFSVKDYCGDWHQIFEVGNSNQGDIEPDIVWPPESDFSACGKAFALTKILQDVGNTIWDNVDNDPVSAWSNVNQAHPQIMSMGWTISTLTAGASIALLMAAGDSWYGPELFDESTWETITCFLVELLDDSSTLPDADTLFTMLLALTQAQWPLDILATAFWGGVIKAIGANDLRNVGLGGATDTDRDCDCPEPIFTPDPAQWAFTGEWSADTEDTGHINSVDVQYGGRRVEIEIEYNADEGFGTVSGLHLEIEGQTADDTAIIRVYPKAGTLHVPDRTWEVTDDPTPSNLWFDMSLSTMVGEVDTRQNQIGYVDHNFDDGVGIPSDVTCTGLRQHKDGASGPGNIWQFVVEIISVNGVAVQPIGPGA